MLKGTAELDNQATAKTFVPSETLHSCQQADATGSSTPRPLSNGRWGGPVSPVTGPSLKAAVSPHSSRVLRPAHPQSRLGPNKDSETVCQPAGPVSIPVVKRSWVPFQQHGRPSETESPSILPRQGPKCCKTWLFLLLHIITKTSFPFRSDLSKGFKPRFYVFREDS